MMKLHNIILTFTCFMLITMPAKAQNPNRNPFLEPIPIHNTISNSGSINPPSVNLSPCTAIKIHPLSYLAAPEAVASLQGLVAGKLGMDKNSNSLIYQGSEQEHHILTQLLNRLDKPTNQITLEAKIIAINQEHNKNLGINWNWDTIPQRDSNDDDDTNESNDTNFGGNFKFWRGYAFRFNATLNALISKGRARVLARPHIITTPGREASIFIGDHIPVQTEKHDNSGNYMATEYIDAGIKLQYTPLISQDGKMVTAKVHTEVSTPVLISELKNYRITSRTADTHVRMFSGQTLVIGGLINEEEQNTLQKVPFLGDLPLLGHLFRNRTKKSSKVEVMLLLTPHITPPGESPAIKDSNAISLSSPLSKEVSKAASNEGTNRN